VRVRTIGIEECASVDGPAVVLDVMRAFTVAAWAFERGAARIVLSNSEDEALELRDRLGAIAINDGLPDGRFDLLNSPDQVSGAALDDRVVVLRTDAGTAGAIASRHAPLLFCTGLVTAAATVRELVDADIDDVTLVATGGEDDVACADYLTALLVDGHADPAPFLARAAAAPIVEHLAGFVRQGNAAVGPRDVELCLEVDRFDFAMRATDEDGLLTLVRIDEVSSSPSR
jgi:2-phosphosulfolactate phosphatase